MKKITAVMLLALGLIVSGSTVSEAATLEPTYSTTGWEPCCGGGD